LDQAASLSCSERSCLTRGRVGIAPLLPFGSEPDGQCRGPRG
jgi:hypothetical protein